MNQPESQVIGLRNLEVETEKSLGQIIHNYLWLCCIFNIVRCAEEQSGGSFDPPREFSSQGRRLSGDRTWKVIAFR